eukprot:1501878-Rhodomonas_salina.3
MVHSGPNLLLGHLKEVGNGSEDVKFGAVVSVKVLFEAQFAVALMAQLVVLLKRPSPKAPGQLLVLTKTRVVDNNNDTGIICGCLQGFLCRRKIMVGGEEPCAEDGMVGAVESSGGWHGSRKLL